MRTHKSITALLLTIAITFFIQGCATSPRNVASQDIDQVLNPVTDSLLSKEKAPLVFPASVGILMIPSNNSLKLPNTTLRLAADSLKKELLKNSRYINRVAIVNNSDLGKKFSLEDIRQAYAVDIVAVITFEQDQRSRRSGIAALSDIAVIPAFTVPTVELKTTSVVEGTIVHVPSNAVIFRTTGIDDRSTNMPSFTAQENGMREESIKGLAASAENFGMEVSQVLTGLTNFRMSNAVSMNDVIGGDLTSTEQSSANKKKGPENQWEQVNDYKRTGGTTTPWNLIVLVSFFALIKRRFIR
ncbi:hypothetical protein [Hahella ganghwensis]|uniref:hypothetical protein n=1 Tax=Hahella ganghwensis TaxID=286420 RepID=UPI000378FEA0|nr:hypothetical protein [Hahella ganghwensis]